MFRSVYRISRISRMVRSSKLTASRSIASRLTTSRSSVARSSASRSSASRSSNSLYKYQRNIRFCSNSSSESNDNDNKNSNGARNGFLASVFVGGIIFLFYNKYYKTSDGYDEPVLIFQLGSFPWAASNEPTSGSAILHESQHNAYNTLSNVKSFSVFPSGFHRQKNDPSRPDLRILELDTDVPKYSHSGFRWSGLNNDISAKIENDLTNLVYDYMLEIEKTENRAIKFFVCHHTFMNVIVAMKVMEKRKENGLPIPHIASFLHGTAMKMYEHEINGEWNSKHYQNMTDLGAFASPNEKGFVNILLSNSSDITQRMMSLFPSFDENQIILAYPGFNTVFKHIPESTNDLQKVLKRKSLELTHIDLNGKKHEIPNLDQYKYLVLVVGKLAKWKRFDSVIKAAKIYESEFGENEILTLIVGKQLKDENIRLQNINDSIDGPKNVFFTGPKMQPELVHLYNAASVGVFPSKDEPFGLVLIESLACGTPVIGANSGGPAEFIKPNIGGLVDESDDIDVLSKRVSNMVVDSIKNDWKSKMKKDAIQKASSFTVQAKTKDMLDEILSKINDK